MDVCITRRYLYFGDTKVGHSFLDTYSWKLVLCSSSINSILKKTKEKRLDILALLLKNATNALLCQRAVIKPPNHSGRSNSNYTLCYPDNLQSEKNVLCLDLDFRCYK